MVTLSSTIQIQPMIMTKMVAIIVMIVATMTTNSIFDVVEVEAFTVPVPALLSSSSSSKPSLSQRRGLLYHHHHHHHGIDRKTRTQAQAQTLLYQSKKASSDSTTTKDEESLTEILFNKYEDEIDEFCQSTYNFWKQTVIPPVRDYVEIQKLKNGEGTEKGDNDNNKNKDFISKLIGPPELPGVPREVWFVILASIPTGLLWYGYYKFSIEEELYHLELESGNGKVSGFGGYGTLFPFVYGIIIGFPLSFLPGTPGPLLVQLASFWILASQVNLYRRVNELCMEEGVRDKLGFSDGNNDDGPLYEWWALLPPPLDVVVGLRQIHFLSEYWRIKRGEEYSKDTVAEDLFPFIAWNEKITLKQFFRTPSKWFWFTKDMKDFEYEFLKD